MTLAAFLIVGAFAAALVILALCQAANDEANPNPKEYDDHDE